MVTCGYRREDTSFAEDSKLCLNPACNQHTRCTVIERAIKGSRLTCDAIAIPKDTNRASDRMMRKPILACPVHKYRDNGAAEA